MPRPGLRPGRPSAIILSSSACRQRSYPGGCARGAIVSRGWKYYDSGDVVTEVKGAALRNRGTRPAGGDHLSCGGPALAMTWPGPGVDSPLAAIAAFPLEPGGGGGVGRRSGG